MSRKKQEHTTLMPSSEELKTAGIRELTAQELLAVNGGKRTRKANSGGSSGGGSSGSSGSARGSSGGSSSSGRSRRSAGTSSSSNDSSKSNGKENKKPKAQSGTSAFDEKKSKPPVQSGTPSVNNPNAGERKRNEEKQSGSMDYTVQKGDTLSGIVRKQYPGASKEEIVRKVKEAAANSGITDINKIEPGQKIVFEKPAQSSSGQPNAGEATSPTQGGAPRGKRQRPTNSGSSGSSTSTSSGGSSSSGGESFDQSSQERDRDSDRGNCASGGDAGFNPETDRKRKPRAESKKGLGEIISSWFNGKRESASNSAKQRFSRASKDGTVETQNVPTEQEKQGLKGNFLHIDNKGKVQNIKREEAGTALMDSTTRIADDRPKLFDKLTRKREKKDYSKTEARYGSFPNGSQEETTAWGWQHSLSQNTKNHINKLHPDIRDSTKNMMVNLYNSGVNVEIVSSLRPFAEQDKLYSIGRDGEKDNRKIVTYAKGGESFHNYGLAFDVEVYNNKHRKNWDVNSTDWQKVIAEGQAQGFEAGATWEKFKDYPHFENSFGLSTKQLLERINNNQSEGGFVHVK